MKTITRELTRLKKLALIERENGMNLALARKEARTGPQAARREEILRIPAWKIQKGG